MASVVFLATASLLCVAALMAIIGITSVAMKGSEAIERDGLSRGARTPDWSIQDSSGRMFRSPPAEAFQLVIFADHSLQSFPSVIEGLRELREDAPQLEMIVLLRCPSPVAEAAMPLLGLEGVPVLTGSPSLYGRYNVRVMPWLMIVSADGRVRGSSLVNHAWQVEKLWRLARLPLPLDPPGRPGARTLAWLRG